MSIESDLHIAVMAPIATITDYPVLWPQKGGDVPNVEHIRANHLPNDNDRVFLSGSDPIIRKGFIVLTLVSPLNEYEVVTKRKAGEIAAAYQLDTDLAYGTVSMTVHNVTIKAGREEGTKWETPIWIEYRGAA